MFAMNIDYRRFALPFATTRHQRETVQGPVVVVGGGPVGLTAAIDLAERGIAVILLDDDDRLSSGSRAICFAKRTLEIWDRLGCGHRMVEKGVSWSVGKVFFRGHQVYAFDLLPESGHQRPAFINLQQYYCEGFLYEHGTTLANLDMRWRNKVIGIDQSDSGVRLHVDTPDGSYSLDADYVVACDGSRSSIRRSMNLDTRGTVFRDRFLIADVRMKADFPAERWFWFDPPFHPDRSVLLHMQPDNVWRVDFQLGWDADPEFEKQPENVAPRVRELLGPDVEFELDWVSVYTFACQRMEKFRHGRVIFAGDAAHGVSPFGARGANSGIQDADNLAWKLALVLAGKAPERLLDTYGSEREYAADENILNSTRSTDFITPKSEVSRTFRDAVLRLSTDHPFARRLVNSGRLSVPAILRESVLNTPDVDTFENGVAPGAPAADAPIRVDGRPDWFLSRIRGEFMLILFAGRRPLCPDVVEGLRPLRTGDIPVHALVVAETAIASREGIECVEDIEGLVARRFDALPGTCYLLRPDQHVCARWRHFDAGLVRAALAHATCNEPVRG
jgi:3-(3-hydroxy-phenyl)propionate hydroxylase